MNWNIWLAYQIFFLSLPRKKFRCYPNFSTFLDDKRTHIYRESGIFVVVKVGVKSNFILSSILDCQWIKKMKWIYCFKYTWLYLSWLLITVKSLLKYSLKNVYWIPSEISVTGLSHENAKMTRFGFFPSRYLRVVRRQICKQNVTV